MARIGDGAVAAPAGLVSSLDVQPQAQAQAVAQPAPAVDAKPAVAAQPDAFQANAQQQILPGGCFPPPRPLPFPLPEPQPLPLPHPLPPFPPFPQPRDASVAAATDKLDQQPGPISGEDMAKAIKTGTEDKDGAAAGREYKQFSDWATKNQDKLSPEAQNVMKVYTQYAKTAQAQGKTGLDEATFDKMCAEMDRVGATDVSVKQATDKLDQQPGPISGEDMAKAIKTGTEDLDNSSAGKEFKQFSDWATKNQDKLSPEAKEVMKTYEKYAKAAQAQGQTGMDPAQYKKMCSELNRVGATDVSAKEAIDGLRGGGGKISGEDMTKAIENGTKDLDGHSASNEFDQFARFAKNHPDRLSPEAKQVMDIYKKYADAAKANGQTGINPGDYQKMLGEMKNVKTYQDESMGNALDKLNHTKGTVGGNQMLDAIKNGSQDTDGQAAGTELQDLLKWSRDNAGRLSPEAKKLVAIYTKYATQAILQGQTGIDQGEYQKMLAEMKRALAPPPRFVAA